MHEQIADNGGHNRDDAGDREKAEGPAGTNRVDAGAIEGFSTSEDEWRPSCWK